MVHADEHKKNEIDETTKVTPIHKTILFDVFRADDVHSLVSNCVSILHDTIISVKPSKNIDETKICVYATFSLEDIYY